MSHTVHEYPKLERTHAGLPGVKGLVRRFFADVLTHGDERAIDALVAPDARITLPTGRFAGREAVRRACAQMRSLFPDLRIEIGSIIAEGAQMAAEWRLCGTEQREFLGVPPSGRWTCMRGRSLTRIEGGRIVEHRMIEGGAPAAGRAVPPRIERRMDHE